MNNRKLIVIAILIIIGILFFGVNVKNSKEFYKPSPTPTDTPISTPNAPKTFQFNSSTDLKMELEKVNPEVLDSDFE